jgi:hypothetical protein
VRMGRGRKGRGTGKEESKEGKKKGRDAENM